MKGGLGKKSWKKGKEKRSLWDKCVRNNIVKQHVELLPRNNSQGKRKKERKTSLSSVLKTKVDTSWAPSGKCVLSSNLWPPEIHQWIPNCVWYWSPLGTCQLMTPL
jgi:hypothetical protein